MISKLKEEIIAIRKSEGLYSMSAMVERHIIALLMLKHNCDNNIDSYEELIQKNKIPEFSYECPPYSFTLRDVRSSLLKYIQYENLNDLVMEFINERGIGIDFINSDNRKLCISTSFKREIYDIKGNTTYIIDKYPIAEQEIATFKFFDEVLKNDNEYLNYNDMKTKDYKYLYFYDDIPQYRFRKTKESDIYSLIYREIDKNLDLKVILHTEFKRIANVGKVWFYVKKYMSKVVLFNDDNTFVYFENKDNNNISIINYDKEKVKSLDKLSQIIDNNRKLKDVLIKITTDDIKDNNYRIGFKLYQTGYVDQVRSINEIVDENTRLIERLGSINSNIENEINKLINR